MFPNAASQLTRSTRLRAIPERPVHRLELVARPARVELLLVEAGLDVVEGGRGRETPLPRLERLDARALEQVMAAARRLLRERARALEPLHPEPEHEEVLVEERGHEVRVRLARLERHPVVTVRGEEGEPFVEPARVEQERLVVDELDEVAAGGSAHPALSPGIDIVMNRFHAANWFRIWRSLVPLTTAVAPWSSPPAWSRSRFTHSIPSETSPACMRS